MFSVCNRTYLQLCGPIIWHAMQMHTRECTLVINANTNRAALVTHCNILIIIRKLQTVALSPIKATSAVYYL